jgi:DNA-binding transcriptional regulator LsrR (DeoR family)
LLTVTTAQLREVKTIILVAGGRRKAMAIHHLLAKEELNIRYLCTDEETAKTLIDSTSGPKSP